MVYAAATHLEVPIFCKIRLCNRLKDTLDFARGLQNAGCSVLAVHGRKRGSKKMRRCGPADLQAIKAVRDAVDIPVISNGNIQEQGDIQKCLSATKADGVMSAEGILKNPGIFSQDEIRLGDLALEYLTLCSEVECPPPLPCIRQHLSWMLGKTGHGRSVRYKYLGCYQKHKNLNDALLQATNLSDFQIIVEDCLQAKNSNNSP
mmetsp:Transcript_23373/g.30525  ORF Transcript_23373/g.30525 Transcript_23373/m.30525 type:complete len:204 (-) Transcript_23373:37-648(-)